MSSVYLEKKKKKSSVNQGCAHTVEGAALGPVDGLSSSGGGDGVALWGKEKARMNTGEGYGGVYVL